MFLVSWIDNDPTEHEDWESLQRELEARPTEVSCAAEFTETGLRKWTAEELADEVRIQQDQLAAEKRHDASLEQAL